MPPIKRIVSLCLTAMCSLAMTGVCAPMTASAKTVPMTWKPMDKAYISIVIDDNNYESQRLYDLITVEYGFPLCAAVPVKSFDKTLNAAARPASLTLLHNIQDNGGEILSHTLTHKVFNRDVDWDTVDYELGESYRRLTAEGFRVNGVILAGGGGTEDKTEEYRAEIEQYTSKYYDYSDYYGVSTQYDHPRKKLYDGFAHCKNYIDEAIENKTWEVLAGHGISTEIVAQSEDALRTTLDYLKQKQDEGVLEVVTYRDAHKRFAKWGGPVDLDTISTTTTTTTATTTTTTTTAEPTTTTTTTISTQRATGTTAPEPSSPESDTPETAPDVSDNAAEPIPKTNALPFVILGVCAVIAIAAVIAVLLWSKKS